MDGTAEATAPSPAVLEVLREYWGFESLRPLQAEAIEAGIAGEDSLVVMPTGGGKSLCYQVPPLVAGRLDVVVSPLIALMKDQVDGLREAGYPAAALHSQLDPEEREAVRASVRDGSCRLLFVTPERLLTPRFLDFLERRGVRSFAIDEAHCISQWGHDFRPEYRRLAELKARFPDASLHAYTATATPRVREDIVRQLELQAPRVLVGRFDRPNLVYRVLPAGDVHAQVLEVIQRHEGEAAIVYCLSRDDTEAMAAYLAARGIRAGHYHAGMGREDRRAVQEAFAAERIDVVTATVAFGMGIDRSNVRCVIHAAMPKSIEHYQQETGRAGRDGLEAECVLLYSGAGAARWEGLIRKSAAEAGDPDAVARAQLTLLRQMQGFCNTLQCRHRALSRHFGQDYEPQNCGACDVCLGEVEPMAESTTIAQKILSCVARLGRPYGARYLVQVLRGSNAQEVVDRGHDALSTHGILQAMPEKKLQHLVYQLVDLGVLARDTGDYPVLLLTEEARSVLRGEREVPLIDPRTGPAKKTRADADAWEGVDRELFEKLRALRRELAETRGVPPYVILNDATLRGLARIRPSTRAAMARVRGIGTRKLEEFGDPFLEQIDAWCNAHGLARDVGLEGAQAAPETPPTSKPNSKRPNPQKLEAMRRFAEGESVEAVAVAIGRAMSTTWSYLLEYIEAERPERIDPWVSDAVRGRVIEAATELAADRLRPIFEHLGGEVPYEKIRAALTHHRALHEAEEDDRVDEKAAG